MNEPIVDIENGVEIRIKVVPGSRSDQVAGLLGDRIKVRISAPPEGGKANKAVIRLLAKHLGIKPKAITLTTGHHAPEKTLRVDGIDLEQARRLLGK